MVDKVDKVDLLPFVERMPLEGEGARAKAAKAAEEEEGRGGRVMAEGASEGLNGGRGMEPGSESKCGQRIGQKLAKFICTTE